MMFDTHCHLHLPQLKQILPQLLARSRQRGVTNWMTLGLTVADWADAKALAAQEKGVFWGAGLHPLFLNPTDPSQDETQFASLEDLLTSQTAQMGDEGPAMLGECGLDKRIDATVPMKRQRHVLEAHLSLAKKCHLPLSLHVVGAHEALFEALGPYKGELRGVLHCFSGSVEQARRYLTLGHFAFGFGGSLTLPSKKRQKLIRWLPEELILTETDAPDGPGFSLACAADDGSPDAPTSQMGDVMGERHRPVPLALPEPAFIPQVVQTIALERHEPLEKWRELSHRNAMALVMKPISL